MGSGAHAPPLSRQEGGRQAAAGGRGRIGQPFQGLELIRREGAHLRLKSGVLAVGLLVYGGAGLGQLGLEALEGASGGVAAAAEVLKNGRFHWIPNTIHDIGYDKPVELAGLIKEFLAEE